MLVSTKAIVLNAIKYSDFDLIVKCYTYDYGVKSYLLKGILKSKKGKLKTAYFQPFTQLKIIAKHNNKGNLNSIREAEVTNHYFNIFNDIKKQSIIIFLSELLSNCLQEEEENNDLYNYLEGALNWLDKHSSIGNFHIVFLLNLTKYLGFYPKIENLQSNYFNLSEGVFTNTKPTYENIYGTELMFFKQLLGTDFDELGIIEINSKNRQELLAIIIRYFELHLSGFKKPKSLSVLKSVFN